MRWEPLSRLGAEQFVTGWEPAQSPPLGPQISQRSATAPGAMSIFPQQPSVSPKPKVSVLVCFSLICLSVLALFSRIYFCPGPEQLEEV